MSRFTLGFALVLIQLSASMAFASPGAQKKAFIACSEVAANSAEAHVQIQVSRPYADNSIVRVEVRESRADGSQMVTLNDLVAAPEHDLGVFQNHLFRLEVSAKQNLSQGEQAGHIDFLYDQGIRFSADLTCVTL
jgi:hypothetical protein